MAGPQPGATAADVLAAVAELGVRAILATGWGGLRPDRLPEGVVAVEQVPHDLLLPHVAAVVHHGGAGTTGAAAAAGRPQVVCPFVADQPFWGRRMHDLGVAPPPLPQQRLDADQLAAALDLALTDTAISARAAELGHRIRQEDGIAAAAAQLELLVADGASR
jgi:sterol 3beta-glucosyltransferase